MLAALDQWQHTLKTQICCQNSSPWIPLDIRQLRQTMPKSKGSKVKTLLPAWNDLGMIWLGFGFNIPKNCWATYFLHFFRFSQSVFCNTKWLQENVENSKLSCSQTEKIPPSGMSYEVMKQHDKHGCTHQRCIHHGTVTDSFKMKMSRLKSGTSSEPSLQIFGWFHSNFWMYYSNQENSWLRVTLNVTPKKDRKTTSLYVMWLDINPDPVGLLDASIRLQ